MKGIILAGGSGSRLYPLTLVTSKQLLPVYDKPMIYYPLSVLMMAKIRNILIISTKNDINNFKSLLGNGLKFGIRLSYAIQDRPLGLVQAFIIGEKFIGKDACALILGDNIFHGAGLINHLRNSVQRAEKEHYATFYGRFVKDPQRFGIAKLNKNGQIVDIVEKPRVALSNYAVTGLYFYPKGVSKVAKTIKISKRGEYEISDLNKKYIKTGAHFTILGRGYSWIDTGTHDSLADASLYIKYIEEHQGIKVCCPEEIAYTNGWISKLKILRAAKKMGKNQYSEHLYNVAFAKIKYE